MDDITQNDLALQEARKKLAQIINANFDNQDSFVKLTYTNPPLVREHNTTTSPKDNKI